METSHTSSARLRGAALGLALALVIPVSPGFAAPTSPDTRWFQTQYLDSGKKPRAAIAFLLAEYRERHYPAVSAYARKLLAEGKLTVREQAETLQLLALAERRLDRPEHERRAWMRFYNLTFSSDALLRVIQLHHQAGRYRQALDIANRVQVEKLSRVGKTLWYRELGALYHDAGQMNNAVYIRKRLTEIDPTADNWLGYSESLLALGKAREADDAIDMALLADPDQHDYLLQKLLVANALGEPETARRLMARLALTPEERGRLQLLLSETGQLATANDSSPQAIKQSIEALDQLETGETLNRHVIDLARLSLQSKLRQRENRWHVGVSETVCRDDNGCRPRDAADTQRSATAGLRIEAGYQFHPRVSLSAGLNTGNENNSPRPDNDTAYGDLTLTLRPLASPALEIAVQQQFAIGDQARDNTRATLAGHYSAGDPLEPGPTGLHPRPYVELHAEASKLVREDKAASVWAEARLGRGIPVAGKAAVAPFFYLQEYYRKAEQTPPRQTTEAGLGVVLDIRQFSDPYKGDLGKTQLFFKAGRDLYVRDGDEEFRTQMGLSFDYQ
ncbi:MAG TPA: hypothetical protein ENK26_07840 [Gammaproteobacteria bacterium]|nr:hypothetical protein [Gammaproteobacteria bacterium]